MMKTPRLEAVVACSHDFPLVVESTLVKNLKKKWLMYVDMGGSEKLVVPQYLVG